MKLNIALMLLFTGTGFAQVPSAAHLFGDVHVRHVIGLDSAKRNLTGQLALQNGVLEFRTGATSSEVSGKVPVASIDDIFIGTETTQVRGKKALAVKTASYAAPFETGRALSILMRNKVDILTLSFHDADGALHAAIFALPLGQGDEIRAQLVQAGAHASPAEK